MLQSEVRMTRWKIGRRYEIYKSLYFLVKWKSYPDEESTWEPGTSLELVLQSIEEFYRKNLKTLTIST
jgi:hypothetical protein